jgi:hypothetical protein
MSRSNAAAIRRRTGLSPSETPPAPTPSSNPASTSSANQQEPRKLTLPEVITLFDSRISKLEANLKPMSEQVASNTSSSTNISNLNEILDEFNHRFEVIADELTTLKDTLLSLQTYTMDVNKMLLNERVRVLSDLGNNVQLTTTDDAEITSVFSLASEVSNLHNAREPTSPTSVDMRQEINK